MNIEIFDASNSYNRRGKPAMINFDKRGRINFSVEAVKLLQLKETDKLAFAYNKKDPGIIYFYPCDAGIPLYSVFTPKGTLRLSVYCRPLARKLMTFFGFKENRSFKISAEKVKVTENTKAWFILKTSCHGA